jgi:uncharacterized protein YuzE
MKWTYDIDASALYVYLGDGEPDRQVETGDGIVLDIDVTGAPVGVEVLAPWSPPGIEALVEHGVDPIDVEVIRWVLTSPLMGARSRRHASLRVEQPATTNSPHLDLIPA